MDEMNLPKGETAMTSTIEGVTGRTPKNTGIQNEPAPSRILIVDDNHQVVVTVSLMLEKLGYVIDAANCGVAALNCLGQYNYDAVLTDFEMPDMAGDALADRVREKWPDTGVVIMTGGSDVKIKNDRENELSEHWIFKPFSMQLLKTTMDRVSHSDFNEVACFQA